MWTSTVLRGGATTRTTSVPSKRPLLTSLCRCLPAPHHCGDRDRFRAIGLTFMVSLNRLNPIGTGKYGFMVLICEVLDLRPTDQSCHHEAWLHLDFVGGMTYSPNVRNMIKGSSCKNGRRHTITARREGVSVKCERPFVFVVIRLCPWERPTTRVLRASSPSDLMTPPFPSDKCMCLVHSCRQSSTPQKKTPCNKKDAPAEKNGSCRKCL